MEFFVECLVFELQFLQIGVSLIQVMLHLTLLSPALLQFQFDFLDGLLRFALRVATAIELLLDFFQLRFQFFELLGGAMKLAAKTVAFLFECGDGLG